jgi:peptidoglycan/LPS O-acetylase OafA/YrhL
MPRDTRWFPSWIPAFATNHAALGVQIFFVISGYLITTLLLEEEKSTGTISLKLFYARRTMSYLSSVLSFLALLDRRDLGADGYLA